MAIVGKGHVKIPKCNQQGNPYRPDEFKLAEEFLLTKRPSFQVFENKKEPDEIFEEDIAKITVAVECCYGCGRFVNVPRNIQFIGGGKFNSPCGKCSGVKHYRDGKRIDSPKFQETKSQKPELQETKLQEVQKE